MNKVHCKQDENWLAKSLESIRDVGYILVEGMLDSTMLESLREAMHQVQKDILRDVGREGLEMAGEAGVLRLMCKYDPIFFKLLEISELLQIVDHTVSNTAILHLQNGFILPSVESGNSMGIFQTRFHPDFSRTLNGYMASINLLFSIDEFNEENGGTRIVPGTHQRMDKPDPEYLESFAIPVICPPGSSIVFDSTLWHAAGVNRSGKDRLGINHQFTRSFFKQQIDYCRALGESVVISLPERTQQILGWYTRVVTSLDEYYRPNDHRLYRSGQG